MIGVQRTDLIEIQGPELTRIHRLEIISIRVQRTGMIMVGQCAYMHVHSDVSIFFFYLCQTSVACFAGVQMSCEGSVMKQ